jgi:flap endonuclease-1
VQGFFWRTIAMLRVGIKPLYVFDGKPPELKSGEIAKRNERRAEGAAKLQEAKDLQAVDDINKFSKRTLRVTRQHAEDCKRLLKLMGVPTLDAPCEVSCFLLLCISGAPHGRRLCSTFARTKLDLLQCAALI